MLISAVAPGKGNGDDSSPSLLMLSSAISRSDFEKAESVCAVRLKSGEKERRQECLRYWRAGVVIDLRLIRSSKRKGS
jgi:hypothetical protein